MGAASSQGEGAAAPPTATPAAASASDAAQEPEEPVLRGRVVEENPQEVSPRYIGPGARMQGSQGEDDAALDAAIAVQIATRRCAKCGRSNPGSAKFCCRCGAAIGPGADEPQNNMQSQNEERERKQKIIDDSEPPPEPAEDRASSPTVESIDGSPQQAPDSPEQDPEAIRQQSQDIVVLQESATKMSLGANVPPVSIEIVFWFKGELYPVRFGHRPIGIRWKEKPPVTMCEVVADSPGERKGVRKGWQVKMVEGIDCQGKPYAFIAKALNDALDKLPWDAKKHKRAKPS